MVTALQVSWAVATPVALVVLSAGQSSTRSGGQVMVGLVVSRTMMVCTQLALLPQASVAVQVRKMVSVAPQLLLTESLYVISTALQVSVAVAMPLALVEVSAGHSKVRFDGQVITGRVVSRTVIV